MIFLQWVLYLYAKNCKGPNDALGPNVFAYRSEQRGKQMPIILSESWLVPVDAVDIAVSNELSMNM